GPCGVVLAEGAGGLEALQHSRRSIRRGFETVVSGGLEAPIGPYALTCQMANGLLSSEADPADAYRPFDARANGYVPGEGGVIPPTVNLDEPAAELDFVTGSARKADVGTVLVAARGYGGFNAAMVLTRPDP